MLWGDYRGGCFCLVGARKPAGDDQESFGNGYKGAPSAAEVTLVLGSKSVALVQGLPSVALGQDSTLLFPQTQWKLASCAGVQPQQDPGEPSG